MGLNNTNGTGLIMTLTNKFTELRKYKQVKKRDNSLHSLMWSIINPYGVGVGRAYKQLWYSKGTDLTYSIDGFRLVYVCGNPFGLYINDDDPIIKRLDTMTLKASEVINEDATPAPRIPDLMQCIISAKTPKQDSVKWGKTPFVAYANTNATRYFDCRIIKPFSNWFYSHLSNDPKEPDSVQSDITYCHDGKNYRPRGVIMPIDSISGKVNLTLLDSSVIAFID